MRMEPSERKQQILKSAVEVAKVEGYLYITRPMVAKEADITESLINKYFESIDSLKREVLQYSIDNEVMEIIAQHLVMRRDCAIISETLGNKAMEYVRGNHVENS